MYPKLVYKCPGKFSAKKATYNYSQIFTDKELFDMIKAGWREDLQDAIDDYIKTKEAEETPSWDIPKESLLPQPLKKLDSRLTSLTSNRSKSKAR